MLVESAKAADSVRAAEVCAGVKADQIVIFDRAYDCFRTPGCAHRGRGLLGDPRQGVALLQGGEKIAKKNP